MSSKINASDIKNVHIFNRGKELGLCRGHREALHSSIVERIDDLVASRLFQMKFHRFLSDADSNEEINVRIHITGDRIKVQEIDEGGRTVGKSEELDLLEVMNGLEDDDLNEVESINKEILETANAIYQRYLREHGRRHARSISSLARGIAFEPRNRERCRYPTVHEPEGTEGTASHRPTRSEGNPRSVLSITERHSPGVHEELRELQRTKTELQQRFAQLTAENEFLKAHAPEAKVTISQGDHDKLTHLFQDLSSERLSGSSHFPADLKEEFMALPEEVRNAVYYQTYLLVDLPKSRDPWPIGQTVFDGNDHSDSVWNESRSHAVRHFLMHNLASEFAAQSEWKRPPPELLRRFYQLPEIDQRAVYTQLEYIQPKGSDYRGPGHAFAGQDYLSVTNQERSKAIHRAIQDRIAVYHRHHYQQRIEMMENLAYHAQEEQISEREIQ